MTAAAAVSACRSCASGGLVRFLDLGTTPVANALPLVPGGPSPEHPLAVGFCPSCTLVQLLHELPAEELFDADYPYFSSFSDALDAHSRAHVAQLQETGRASGGALVVEVASNDGYLLRHLLPLDVRVLGVEPTPGPAAAALALGIPTVQCFLGRETAVDLREQHGPADVVLANNVLAHVPDLRGFAEGLSVLLSENGILQVENPGVRYLLEHVAFDTVYHEHYCYFSCAAVQALMRSVGLELNDVETFTDLQGGTLRWTFSRRPGLTPRAEAALQEERDLGLTGPEPYLAFGARVAGVQDALRTLLQQVKDDGGSIAGYGAAAKGATLLNSTGIDSSVVDFVVDRSPHKQGRWMPGGQIPVLDPAALLDRRPSHLLVLAWNYLDEVRRQQADYERAGGRLIVPVPVPRVLDRLA